jgi:hypothetical protein
MGKVPKLLQTVFKVQQTIAVLQAVANSSKLLQGCSKSCKTQKGIKELGA